jgi:GMP synthase-like glutamine amidotransferase
MKSASGYCKLKAMKDILFLKHVPFEGPALLGDLARENNLSCVEFLVGGPEPWPEAKDFKALAVLGGPQSVYEEDKFPYLKDEDRFVRDWLQTRKPYLGICLGSQILAKALGAKVYPNEQKEIGWHPVQLTKDASKDTLFAGQDADLMAFHWHGDTFDLPAGAVHLASSALTPNQGFRHGSNAWGLQFHLEVQPSDIREWTKAYDHEVRLYKPGEPEADIAKFYPHYERIGQKVFRSFLLSQGLV